MSHFQLHLYLTQSYAKTFKILFVYLFLFPILKLPINASLLIMKDIVKQDIKELVWKFLIEAFALVFHVEEMWMLFEQFWFGTIIC